MKFQASHIEYGWDPSEIASNIRILTQLTPFMEKSLCMEKGSDSEIICERYLSLHVRAWIK